MIQIKTLSLYQGNPQKNDQILTLYFYMTDTTISLQFLLQLLVKGTRDRKQIIIKETDTTAIML